MPSTMIPADKVKYALTLSCSLTLSVSSLSLFRVHSPLPCSYAQISTMRMEDHKKKREARKVSKALICADCVNANPTRLTYSKKTARCLRACLRIFAIKQRMHMQQTKKNANTCRHRCKHKHTNTQTMRAHCNCCVTGEGKATMGSGSDPRVSANMQTWAWKNKDKTKNLQEQNSE